MSTCKNEEKEFIFNSFVKFSNFELGVGLSYKTKHSFKWHFYEELSKAFALNFLQRNYLLIYFIFEKNLMETRLLTPSPLSSCLSEKIWNFFWFLFKNIDFSYFITFSSTFYFFIFYFFALNFYRFAWIESLKKQLIYIFFLSKRNSIINAMPKRTFP